MNFYLARALGRIRHWLRPKSIFNPTGWTTVSLETNPRSRREPGANELLDELKNTVFTCASINAAACAAHPPRLYVATHAHQSTPKCRTRALPYQVEKRLRARTNLAATHKQALQIEEVVEHPLLTLLRHVNPVHNSFDLWELTTFHQETLGSAYWLLEFDPLGVPSAIWPLPAQQVTPQRDRQSKRVIDYYELRQGSSTTRYPPERIIHFRYPDPREPYATGLSPLRACWDQAALVSDYIGFKRSTWRNSALPGVIISPEEVMGEEERDRLETQWNQKFQHGGAGKALVAAQGMQVNLLANNMGDLATLAEYGKTKEDIANAFHVPLSFLTSETNLANLQAAEHQHLAKAIAPRLQRRDEKLNEQLVPLYDPSGRLFLASDDPVPFDHELGYRQQELDMKYGLLTINEVRRDRGLPPVAWGDQPWLPVAWAPTDFPDRTAYAPDTGRARTRLERGEEGEPAERG
jgi:HK97 family phage portal protein